MCIPDATLASLVARNLARRGFEAVAAAPVAGSADRGGDDPPGVVIADIDVDSDPCWAAARELRAAYPATGLVLLTHDWPPRGSLSGLEPCRHLRKPFAMGDLLAAVRALASR